MWSAGSEGRLYVGSSMALLEDASAEAAVRIDDDGWLAVIDAMRNRLKERAGKLRRLRVWLSGGLARPFMLETVPGLRDRDEALKMAQALAPNATGLLGPCAVWLDEWRSGQNCLAVATEQAVLIALQSLAEDLETRVASTEPWWNWVLSERLQHDGSPDLLAIEEDDGLTLLGVTHDRVSFAQSQCPRPAADRIAPQLLRVAMSRGIPAERLVRAVFASADRQRQSSAVGAVQWQAGAA